MGEKGSSNTHFISTATIGVSVVPGTGTRFLLPLFSLMGSGTNECCTSTSECGTDTNLLLPCFSALVPIPILVVPVPLYKNFQSSLHFRFHCMLASCTAPNPLQTYL